MDSETDKKSLDCKYEQACEHFLDDDIESPKGKLTSQTAHGMDAFDQMLQGGETRQRDTWTNPREFLISSIAMSVGLGNVWRFPHTAAKYGGGAFLLPYLICLIFIARPLYFLEMCLGQFSSYGAVKLWKIVPILKGVGYAQALAVWMVTTYYCFQMAIALYFLFASFVPVLPWTYCHDDWNSTRNNNCFNTTGNRSDVQIELAKSDLRQIKSSASLYFKEEVIKEIDSIQGGIGLLDGKLSLCLLLSWILIFLVMMRGIKSTGKAAYFTAIFPYVVLITILIRGVTLEGADAGITYFFTPQWTKLLEGETWYAAVEQCYFSLSLGYGPVATFSSYNSFRHNIYRDNIVISVMDTFTSLLAGVTVFSVLGNLAHVTGRNVSDLASESGTGLAFTTYPEAVAKFSYFSHFFAVVFFMMLFTLGLGSTVSDSGCIITVICDAFPKLKRWLVTVIVCLIGFSVGLLYATQGGLYVLDVVDYFGAGFPVYVIAIVEVLGVCWIYGANRFIKDVEFMLNMNLSSYWTLSWAYIIPIVLLTIFCGEMYFFQVRALNGYYLDEVIAIGLALSAFVVIQIPVWAFYVVRRQKSGHSWFQRIRHSLKASDKWGPRNPSERRQWRANVVEPFIRGDSTKHAFDMCFSPRRAD